MDIATQKSQLRAELRALDPPLPEVRIRVLTILGDWLDRMAPTVVVGFLAMGDEIDMTPLVAAHPRVRFALTRTAPSMGLTVHPFDSPRERHPFGFEQPVAGAEVIPRNEIDVVLVPGIAFDRRGRRLGRGAGYYDRFLAEVEAEKVALTIEARLLAEIPVEAHDVFMDWIATEQGVVPAG